MTHFGIYSLSQTWFLPSVSESNDIYIADNVLQKMLNFMSSRDILYYCSHSLKQ